MAFGKEREVQTLGDYCRELLGNPEPRYLELRNSK